jgi:hypothetical protein
MRISLSRAKAICVMTCSLAVLGVDGLGCGGASEQGVARVGRSPISKRTLGHWTSVSAAVDPALAASKTSARRRALDFLIASRWLTGEASEAGVRVSSVESRKQLELLRYDQLEGLTYEPLPKDAQLRSLLTSSRVALADRLWLMRLSILAARIERLRLSQAQREVTREQIARFYGRHRRSFVQRAWRELEIIGNFHKAVVVRAKREVEAGASFLSVARRVSVDSEAPKGLQSLARGDEEPPFEKVVFGARPGVLVGPVEYGFFYIFTVPRSRPERQLTLAESENRIRRRLAEERASGDLLSAFERKWMTRTSCQPTFVVSRCGHHARASQ